MDQGWTEGAWLNGNPVLEPLEDQDYIWIFVKGDNGYSRLLPYGNKPGPDFYLATQYYSYHRLYEDAKLKRQELRWWWKPLRRPELPATE